MDSISSKSSPPTEPPHGGFNRPVLGFLAFCAVALEFKHAVPAVIHPFTGCKSVGDVVSIFGEMSDADFLGFLALVALLVSSFFAILGILTYFFGRLSRTTLWTTLGRRVPERIEPDALSANKGERLASHSRDAPQNSIT